MNVYTAWAVNPPRLRRPWLISAYTVRTLVVDLDDDDIHGLFNVPIVKPAAIKEQQK